MDNRDIHVLKYFSSFVSVSNGRIINITEPTLTFCPLANHLYKNFRGKRGNDKEAIKAAIKSAIESKIKDYGFFTEKRNLSFGEVSIPYGASEMMSFALRKKAIDAAVLVCEGAGTVIADRADIVQGIGARMNSLLLTSPIKTVIQKLKTSGCRVVFENALIDQLRGVKEAIEAGYMTIAVTVCGHSAEDLKAVRLLEKESGVRILSLAVCTTGITKDKINMIRDYADLVWSCASFDIRRIIGPLAKCQLSRQIPVFVLTRNGMDFVSAYAEEEELIKNLDAKKQYLFSNEPSGQCAHLGTFKVSINESKLPVDARKSPSFEDKNEYASV
jgi:putative methanogenesis marker protein 8